MSQPTNHWKLGLFVVISFLLGLLALVYFGAYSMTSESVIYKSYFDESVTGLEVGSKVKFRGVTVGTVSAVEVAPDRRRVEAAYDVGVLALDRLGISGGEGAARGSMPADLRAQIATMGITGQKYILLDFFDVETHPLETLPFKPADNYIPTADSMMKSLEGSVVRAVERFPMLAEDVSTLVITANRLLTDIESKQVPAEAIQTLTAARQTLAQADQLIATMTAKVNQVPAAQLSEDARQVLSNMNLTLTKVQAVIDRIDGDRGLVASMQRATDSVGDVAVSAHGVSDDLSATLRDIREAAISIRQVLDALERDSDMLVKGRAELAE
jgi:paraquat-inducible protein B